MTDGERNAQAINEAATGCTLVFVPGSPLYQPMAALAVLAGLNGKRFSGTCECYIRPGLRDGEYLMAVALDEASEGTGLSESWWSSFVGSVAAACEGDEDVQLHREACEFATVGEMRASLLHAGTAGFSAGSATWVIDPDGPDPDSPFTVLCRRIHADGS
ncbi:MAG: hypothetical protein L0Z62_28625 [Gemmataceae bacterium]|nr:hypothetical protein [Gemmataceae bacterium]